MEFTDVNPNNGVPKNIPNKAEELGEKTEFDTMDLNHFLSIVSKKEETDEYILEIREAKKEEVDVSQYNDLSANGKFIIVLITDKRNKDADGKYDMSISAKYIPNRVDAGQEKLRFKEESLRDMVHKGVQAKLESIGFKDVE